MDADTQCDCRLESYITWEHIGVYDGGLYYECANCHHMWHRWPDKPETARLRQAATACMAARAGQLQAQP